ncbi:hypothetical protein SmJEL517_g03029 [Synchytrium microbalum]|uniref:propanoyl-CoA C-acyltransferase n=1 Tax=Synchytrium microbalum TaxID=1806994 RepID=A0A507C4F3_9FUNG|nr:uncharacterized protein SmJEL517_g03029 [Synchytrium microbalum]TPX34361.1 hypothetical protein SmJEL517_g03029 [Synchytrium microbalum]
MSIMSSARDPRKVYIIGVGMSAFEKPGRRKDFGYAEHTLEAATRALIDAGINYDEVETATVGYTAADSTAGQRCLYQLGLTQIPIINVINACSTGSTALFFARQAVATGAVECALALGFEQMKSGSLVGNYNDRTSSLGFAMPILNELQPMTNAPRNPQIFAAASTEYINNHPQFNNNHHLDMIAQKNHAHSTLNPYSQFKDLYTLEQVHDARTIYGPLTLLHCSPTSDGAGCVIVASEDFVKKHHLEPQAIEIMAQVMATDSIRSFAVAGSPKSAIGIAGGDMTKKAASEAYKLAKITPKDVDVCELHDCFSSNELITYDALGLCEPGHAGEWLASGAPYHPSFAPAGAKPARRTPVNLSGGLISKGHPLGATGLAQCTELTWQLRGWAGKRQVENVKIALQHNVGLGGAVVVGVYRKAFPNASTAGWTDPRVRHGFNPAVEHRPITMAEVNTVKSKGGSLLDAAKGFGAANVPANL